MPAWCRHQIETFSALLAVFAGNSSVPGEFPAQRPVRRSFDILFDLRPNIRLSKHSWGWWFETPSHPLWRHFVLKLAEVRQISTLIIHIIRWHLYNKSAQLYEYASRLGNKFIGIQPYIRCLHKFNYLCHDTSYHFLALSLLLKYYLFFQVLLY